MNERSIWWSIAAECVVRRASSIPAPKLTSSHHALAIVMFDKTCSTEPEMEWPRKHGDSVIVHNQMNINGQPTLNCPLSKRNKTFNTIGMMDALCLTTVGYDHLPLFGVDANSAADNNRQRLYVVWIATCCVSGGKHTANSVVTTINIQESTWERLQVIKRQEFLLLAAI